MKSKITCSFCGKSCLKENGHINRARKKELPLFCSKKCFSNSRKTTKADKIEKKRLYDIEYRKRPEYKIKKAESFKRNYDPVKAAIKRKDRAQQHKEYCQRPEYKLWKAEYDRKYRAKRKYGEFWESFLLLMNLEEEVYSRLDYYTIKLNQGVLNKTQKRKRYERSNSK